MPAILLIIFQIIAALPSLISAIKTIIELIRQIRNPSTKAMYQARFKDILAKVRSERKFTLYHGKLFDDLHKDLLEDVALQK